MHIDVLTLFPEMLTGMFQSSILNKAHEKNKYSYDLINFRDFTENKHQKVDDYPYGGGAGMVLTPQLFLMRLIVQRNRRIPQKNRALF